MSPGRRIDPVTVSAESETKRREEEKREGKRRERSTETKTKTNDDTWQFGYFCIHDPNDASHARLT